MKKCAYCQCDFTGGKPSWCVKIKVWAATDDTIPENETSDAAIDTSIEKILRRIQITDAQTLQNEVYQEFNFRLCRTCRDRFCANPLNIPWDKEGIEE